MDKFNKTIKNILNHNSKLFGKTFGKKTIFYLIIEGKVYH